MMNWSTRLFRFMKRMIIRGILLLAIFVVVIGGYLVYGGYQMYQAALEEKPIQQMAEEIRMQSSYTSLEQIPQIYLDAVISVEDHRFYQHDGLDYVAIIRAMYHNVKAGEFMEGGSTITQQLAKNQFFTQRKELTRKFAEVFMVQELERLLEKDEILELYINSIYYGDGYYCIADASRGYFGKEPWKMTSFECVLLAGIPNAPSVYAPTVNPELAIQRQRQVLQEMVHWGYLTEAEVDLVIQE